LPARNRDLHGNAPDRCAVALFLIDVLNDLDFPGAAPLVKSAPKLAKAIAALKRRCREAGIPAIYINDNRYRWRSDVSAVLAHCLRPESPGRWLVEPLIPLPDDYIILKPKHSAFYATPLDTLLAYLGTRTAIVTGVTTDACILTTASDLHIRDLNVIVPSDCVAAKDRKRHAAALDLMKGSFGARIGASRRLSIESLIKGQ
jgi:nicotinamidase-related amidase